MQADSPAARGLGRARSRSSPLAKDPDTITIASLSTVSPSKTPSITRQPLIPPSVTAPSLAASRDERKFRALQSSATWTSSSGDMAMFSDNDEIEDRTRFVLEYNRLAKKHGIRMMVVGDFAAGAAKRNSTPATMSERRHWLSRLLRHTSLAHGDAPSKLVRHRRSFSDLTLHLMRPKRDLPQPTISLQAMVTLNGKSLLYLPAEFSPRALLLPTCFRATAQYLIQHGVVSRGIFRISGSYRTVNALFDYYCHQDAEVEVTRTIRCPNLPQHIKAGVHDVASVFKRFLGVLPGGILGSLALFDALIAIHSQLRGEPEYNRTRQTKLRARLIALAIGTLKSQFRRELICAVFGMLSLIGRQAELTPHEDDLGRPLPTNDLMGYTALGTIFGPLLVGNLLDSYTMKVAHPSAGLLLFPLTPPKLQKERAHRLIGDGAPPTVDKILVANQMTEMVITHWREIVRHLANVGTLGSFLKPRDWDLQSLDALDRPTSPPFGTPTPYSRSRAVESSIPEADVEELSMKRSRLPARSQSWNRIGARQSLNPLSPTAEESLAETSDDQDTPGRKATFKPSLHTRLLCHSTESDEPGDRDGARLESPLSRSPAASSPSKGRESRAETQKSFLVAMTEPRSQPALAENVPLPSPSRSASLASVAEGVAEVARRSRVGVTTPAGGGPTPAPVMAGVSTGRKSVSRPNGVKAMAAMWEGSSKDGPSSSTSPSRPKRRLTGTKPGDVVSPYRSNVPVPKSSPPAPLKIDRRVPRSPTKSARTPEPKEAADVDSGNADTTNDNTAPKQTTGQKDEEVVNKPEFMDVQLRRPSETTKCQPLEPASLDVTREPDQPPSLGTMIPHQEEPPVDKHLNLSRPPSATSIGGGATGNFDERGERLEGVPGPTPSPAPSAGNCLLHAQIRNLQKQLSNRSEEVGSLRRQLEAMENMDIGTLSEQLRDAKRECTMWKARAEAAEKRVAVFERFTSRLRGIREANAKEEKENEAEDVERTLGKRTASIGLESVASVNTTGTKNPDAVAERIRHSIKALDGTRSSSVASMASSDGGASAWWNSRGDKGKYRGLRALLGRTELQAEDVEDESGTADSVIQTWVAVEELLAYDDLMKGVEEHL